MRSVSVHNYRNNSVIADLAMGQISRYTQNVFLAVHRTEIKVSGVNSATRRDRARVRRLPVTAFIGQLRLLFVGFTLFALARHSSAETFEQVSITADQSAVMEP